ncbi:LOW QUALITY PROTEIN: F-box protein SKIP19 [Eucalyptus grandis]|uniref:LOW QUALITY PROTEIN: F-box protein SKIP19 n=1 Tax=Eucalyptus grandis TaxID=71139 RepID=UPI00192F04DF|nr:LOW QUALITY PROTEIN: F-box protein SKIP19 [Eucalyptus grandis]
MAAPDEPPPPERNWLELPREIATTILLKLGAVEILTTAQLVCTAWRALCLDPAMWQIIDMRNDEDLPDCDFADMYRRAVDRSRGGCLELNIEHFGDDWLLQYAADRCNHIRRLRLVYCSNISDEGLCEAASKLPMLEVLELSYCSFSKEAIETVGQCCPLLKSFKLNSQGYRYPHIECDDEAQAIVKNMHGLHHLQLFGNKMTNEGLKAILDSCPHLEYLDLRQCFNVYMGDLGRRCTKQIKDLRNPYDPTDDYEFDAAILDDESFDDDYPSGFSDIDLSDYDNYYEFSDYDDFSVYGFDEYQ